MHRSTCTLLAHALFPSFLYLWRQFLSGQLWQVRRYVFPTDIEGQNDKLCTGISLEDQDDFYKAHLFGTSSQASSWRLILTKLCNLLESKEAHEVISSPEDWGRITVFCQQVFQAEANLPDKSLRWFGLDHVLHVLHVKNIQFRLQQQKAKNAARRVRPRTRGVCSFKSLSECARCFFVFFGF